MTGNNPAPWNASCVDLLAEAEVHHLYTVELYRRSTGAMVSVPAYGATVTLDGLTSPVGKATFKTVASELPAGFVPLEMPYRITPCRIAAGYRHAIGGVDTDDLQTVLFGYVTAADTEDGVTTWEVESVESLYDFPSNRTYNVSDAFTRVKQVADALAGASTPLTMNVPIVEGAPLTAPTSTQLSSFRAAELQVGDQVSDWFRMIAQILGHRLRADVRATALQWLITDEPTYDAANRLQVASAYKLRQRASLDQFANTLDISATWIDASTSQTKTAKRTFRHNVLDIGGVTRDPVPDNVRGPVRAKAVTIMAQPPNGQIPDDIGWGPIARWLTRYATKNKVLQTATGRAAYWIQPYDVVEFTALATTLYVNSVVFTLDDGSMTLNGYSA